MVLPASSGLTPSGVNRSTYSVTLRSASYGGHRALADIIESLDELRYYRQAFMAPAPGPNEAESKAIADQIVATSLLNK